MDLIHRKADNLFNAIEHLDQLFDRAEDFGPAEIDLALSITKRVRRDSTILIRELAIQRDELHATGGDKHE